MAGDHYAEWLGIEDKQRPLTNYQLLGLAPFTADADDIESHEQQQLAKLVPLCTGEHALQAKRMAFEIKSAKTCLLNPTTKASYDAGLRGSKSHVSGVQPTSPAEAEPRPPRPLTPPVAAKQTSAPKANREPELEEDCYALAQPEPRVEPVAVLKRRAPVRTAASVGSQRQVRRKKKQWLIPAVAGGAVAIVAGILFVLPRGHDNLQVANTQVDKTRIGGEPAMRQSPLPRVSMPLPNAPKPPPSSPSWADNTNERGRSAGMPASGTRWLNTSYDNTLVYVGGARWIQINNKNNSDVDHFTEVARSPQYIEIRREENHIPPLLRIYGNRLEGKLGDKWAWVANGKWKDIHTDGPPLTSPLSIVSARWGVGNRWADVTSLVKALVHNGNFSVIVPVEPGGLGFPDPAAGQYKYLEVTYSYAGIIKTKSAKAGSRMALPPEPGTLEDQANEPGNPRVAKRSPKKISQSPRREHGNSNASNNMAPISQGNTFGWVQITLPSHAILTQSMLNVPENWKKIFFPSRTNVLFGYYPDNSVHGVFSLDKANKLNGVAAMLYDNGALQTLAVAYKKGDLDGCLKQWDEDGKRVFYAEYRNGKKQGILCLFQGGMPWLIQEWEKAKAENEYLVKWAQHSQSILPTSTLTGSDSEELSRARQQLAMVEKTEIQFKNTLKKWRNAELDRIRWQNFAAGAKDRRAAQSGRISDHNAQKAAANEAWWRETRQRTGL